MMELNFNQPLNKSNSKNEFLINSNDKKNSIGASKGKTDFKKVFDDSKTKSSENMAKTAQSTKQTSGAVKETSDITVVKKPVFEEKNWADSLSTEEQERIKKAVNLLLTFFENNFPEQNNDVNELPTEEQEIQSKLEQVAGENKTEQLVQVFSKELEITTEIAQKILTNLKDLTSQPDLSTIPKNSESITTQIVLPENLQQTNNKVAVPQEESESIISQEKLAPRVSQEKSESIISQEKMMLSPEKSAALNNQQIIQTNIVEVQVDQRVVTNLNSMSTNGELLTNVQDDKIVNNEVVKSVDQALKNLVEKPVSSLETASVATATQIEKLSSAQMPALQSHANFILGKINSELMTKNANKTTDKTEESVVDNMMTAKISSTQTAINMMPLQAKTGQQFADLQNHDKSDLEKTMKPIQETNQVKSNYADLLFSNKNDDVENVELNLLQDRAAISRQIVDNIKVMQRNNNTEMIIRLKPEHMGEMILRISTNASGTISASFQTNNPEARLALEATMLALKQELVANGLKVQDVDLFGGISDFLSGQSQANKDQKSKQSGKSFVEQEEKVEKITDKLEEQILVDDGNVDYRI